MLSPSPISTTRTRLVLTRIPDSWAWVRTDLLVRLLPFTAAYVVAYAAAGRAGWLGLGAGDLSVQLLFALAGVPLMFGAAAAVPLWVTRRRGALALPADAGAGAFQAGFDALNGPIEA